MLLCRSDSYASMEQGWAASAGAGQANLVVGVLRRALRITREAPATLRSDFGLQSSPQRRRGDALSRPSTAACFTLQGTPRHEVETWVAAQVEFRCMLRVRCSHKNAAECPAERDTEPWHGSQLAIHTLPCASVKALATDPSDLFSLCGLPRPVGGKRGDWGHTERICSGSAPPASPVVTTEPLGNIASLPPPLPLQPWEQLGHSWDEYRRNMYPIGADSVFSLGYVARPLRLIAVDFASAMSPLGGGPASAAIDMTQDAVAACSALLHETATVAIALPPGRVDGLLSGLHAVFQSIRRVPATTCSTSWLVCHGVVPRASGWQKLPLSALPRVQARVGNGGNAEALRAVDVDRCATREGRRSTMGPLEYRMGGRERLARARRSAHIDAQPGRNVARRGWHPRSRVAVLMPSVGRPHAASAAAAARRERVKHENEAVLNGIDDPSQRQPLQDD